MSGFPDVDAPGGWAVVAGATGALGPFIVDRLLARQLGVVAVARDEARLARLCEERPSVVPCRADVAQGSAQEAVASVLPGPVRMVVNAASAPTGGGVLDVATDVLTAALEVKVNGTLRLVRAADHQLVSGARIVAIGGNLGYDPVPTAATSGVANAALANLVRQLGQAYGPRGITCHVVAPGPVETPRLRAIAEDGARLRDIDVDVVLEELRSKSPLGRLTTPDEVAWAVALLLEPQASAMAGSTFVLDCGRRTAIP